MDSLPQSPNLEQLFSAHAEELGRYFERRHGTGETARDLVQEAFLQLARSLREERPLNSARGYLFGIARHLSQAVWRRQFREGAPVAPGTAEEPAAPPPDERISEAREVIAAMPPLQREILDLRFAQDLSYAEIAEALNIPVGTVRSRLHHAIAQVRQRVLTEHSNPIPQ